LVNYPFKLLVAIQIHMLSKCSEISTSYDLLL